MSHAALKIGVRGNRLGLSIGRQTAEALRPHLGPTVFELVPVADPSLRGGPSWPGTALERGLAQGEFDLVIQNAKDASPEPPGIVLAAVTPRLTPYDVLVAAEDAILDELPEGAALSAHTMLRRAQLLNYRDDFRIVDFAGSLEERIRMLERGDVDGLVVSAAAVEHLGFQDHVTEIFTTAVLIPAPGQGSAVIQVRSGAKDLLKAARHLNDSDAHAEFQTERAFLRALGADASAPVGALAQSDGSDVRLEGVIAEHDGRRLYKDVETGPIAEAAEIGDRLALRLLAEGGRRALASAGSDA